MIYITAVTQADELFLSLVILLYNNYYNISIFLIPSFLGLKYCYFTTYSMLIGLMVNGFILLYISSIN
jgi:hypothetical protein